MTGSSDPETARRAAAARIPAALERALDHYDRISENPPPEAAKDASGHQAACKAALSHVDAALKLLDQVAPAAATGATETAEQRAALSELVREARTAVARLRRES